MQEYNIYYAMNTTVEVFTDSIQQLYNYNCIRFPSLPV